MVGSLPLWLSLVAPSVFVVQKYAGWVAVSCYLATASLIVVWRTRIPLPGSPAAIRWSAAATVALVVTAFLAIYPVVNVQTPGLGSDDDDAYNIGARALVAGHSPYDQVTYLGNALHPLPGSFFLAMPFVALVDRTR